MTKENKHYFLFKANIYLPTTIFVTQNTVAEIVASSLAFLPNFLLDGRVRLTKEAKKCWILTFPASFAHRTWARDPILTSGFWGEAFWEVNLLGKIYLPYKERDVHKGNSNTFSSSCFEWS